MIRAVQTSATFEERGKMGRTLLAAVNELHAVLEELAGNLEDLLNLVGHCD